MQYGETNELRKTMECRKRKRDGELFFKLHYACFPIIQELKGAFSVYLYMVDNITRGRSNHKWWNQYVLPYFEKRHKLPFAKHQKFMSKDLNISQPTISRHLKLLREKEIIVPLETLDFKKDILITIYSVGNWSTPKGRHQEYYYLERFIK